MWTQSGTGATPGQEQLEAVLKRVPQWQGRALQYQPVSGGISNANWRVRVAGAPSDYFVKVPGRGTEMFIERNAAHEASLKAHACGAGVAVEAFLPELGVEIFQFVEGYRTSTNLDFLNAGIRSRAVRQLRAFNDSGPLKLTKTIFDMIDEHIAQAAELKAWLPPDVGWMLACKNEARAALEASGLDLVPCMNDTLAGNFMLGPDGAVLLVDLEYASNNERAYELALWFGEMFFEAEVEQEMIEAYFGRVTPALEARVAVLRALADLKWSTWAMVQEAVSTLDFDFRKYGVWKYMRARGAFHHPDWAARLRRL